MQWGYPSTVQAIGGTVPGTFNAIPGIRVVLKLSRKVLQTLTFSNRTLAS